MSRIRIVHRSGYQYEPWAMASHNEVRMAPRANHEQLVLSHKIEVTPTAWQHQYSDYWGTTVLAFEIHERHPVLRIVATSEVDVHRPATPRQDVLQWSDLDDAHLHDELCEYLDATPATDVSSFLADVVADVRGQSTSPAEFVRRLQQRIRAQVEYRPGVTSVHSHPVEAWQAGAGVCQDMTHLLLGGLRMAGIPARYVSGYTMPVTDAEVGVPMTGDSHSWVQFWDGEWVGVDPTSGVRPDETFVEVGHGRDYYDVAPLTGIFTGGQTADMYVEVTLTRVS